MMRIGNTLKEIVVEHSIAAVEKASAIMGGSLYFRTSPLERLARDVRAGDSAHRAGVLPDHRQPPAGELREIGLSKREEERVCNVPAPRVFLDRKSSQ